MQQRQGQVAAPLGAGRRPERAVVIAAGQIADYGAVRPHLAGSELVVCADAGVRHARALDLVPHVVVGDFDSLGSEGRDALAAQEVELVVAPRDKDQTDTEMALAEAVRRGARRLLLLGVTGDRLDHTLANLLLLPGLPPDVSATVVDAKNVIRLAAPGTEVVLTGSPGEYVSLLPLSPAVTGIDTEGLRWPLAGGTLAWGQARGVSNEMTGQNARVRVGEGHLLVIQARD